MLSIAARPANPKEPSCHPSSLLRHWPALLAWFWFGVAVTPASAQPANGLLREVYEGIGGVSVSDLVNAPSYPNSPTTTGYVADFEAPTDVLEEYGQRLRGYLVPPVTGNYTFWIASDDGGDLWLSTDDTPERRTRIASVAGWTSPREWSREAGQQSASISLSAGQIYYVEALMKEGGGGDNLAVRWRRPDGVDQGPIPATHLLPWGVALRAPEITRQPSATHAVEGALASFHVQTHPLGPARFQWRRNGLDIPNATGRVLDFGPVSFADQGARFSVALTNTFGSVVSAEAVLTVLPDTTPPALLRAENRAATSVRVVFSEPMSTVPAQTPGNYLLDQGVTVAAATLDADGRSVALTVSPLTFGVTYTLSVVGVTDRAATPNPIAPETRMSFLALEYTPTDIGGPSQTGQVVRRGPGRFDVTGGGVDIGRKRDQFQFASELRTGNFDVQTRIEDVIVSNPFLHAGLMARFSMASNAPFAAVFASSAQLGCFFESRSSVNATSATSAPRNGFPVSYPETWLRLRRVGNTFTGFASVDGVEWNVLGSTVLGNAPNTLFFGLAVASRNPTETTTAKFREVSATTSTREVTLRVDREPLGPFVRSTGLVLSEWHYHPADDPSGRDFEFLELYNAGSIPEDLSGARLSGEIEYTFPEGTRLHAGAFLVVAAAPADVASGYGIQGVLGPYSGRLSNAGGEVELLAREGDRLFAVTYATEYPWPAAADGAGPSLVLSRPSYGPQDPRAWSSSEFRGGSPGRPEPVARTPLAALRINEILAHTDDPQRDFVELFNSGSVELDLSGCILTDNASTPRFVIASGTRLAPRAHVSFDQDQLGFALSSAGETVYLIQPDARRVLDAVRFGPQENGVSLGRQPDGSPVVRRLDQTTPGVANASWRRESVVISELMYHPISRDDADQYLELQNRTDRPIPIGGWEFTDGIDFRLPAGVTLPAAGRLVIAKDPARLRSAHPSLSANLVLGPFSGSLSDRGERVALGRPDQLHRTNEVGVVVTTRVLVDVAEVTYRDGGAWPEWADGGGSSLELTDLNSDPWLGANWTDSDESAKGEWTTVSVTGRLDNGIDAFPPNQLQVTLQGGGEALVDDVEVVESGSTVNLVANAGFEASPTISGSSWTLQGNHATSTIQTGGAASGNRSLSIRTQGRGDTGFNRIRTLLAPGLAEGDTATLRAKVRWVRGWPEVLFRIRGNWLELPATLSVPRNLGTPGAPNSSRVQNAGPAISEVTHTPPLPDANEPVVVTARVSDPDGVGTVRLTGRVDGSATIVNLTLRDDGAGGDAFAGDGIYSATLTGRSSGTLMAFRIEATDGATVPSSTRFPPEAPSRECLVRWGDTVPFGTLGHYHLWSTAATESARSASSALNNLYRDATFVYGHSRVIYGAGFKDKGSPFKGGEGDWYVILPKDQPLLNTDELAIVSTGNNGSDGTQLREQLCFTIARGIGASYLHRRFVRLYRNGSPFRDIMEDTEEPNGEYSERFSSQGERPDLYKIEDWFEFQNDGTSFINVDATLQRFTSPPGQTGAPLKPARYRWNWRKRAVEESANNFTNLLDLVSAMNTGGTSYLPRLFATVDVDQWMRTFAFQRIVGNWDSYGMGRGKNMYAYKRDGMTWKLFSWDVDFALDAGGNGPGDGLWGAGDPTINTMFDTPAIRRRLWQAYRDAVWGPMDPTRAAAEAGARADALHHNGVPSAPHLGALDYIAARRQTIINAYAAADVPALEITSNGGNTLTTTGTTVTLNGRAPLALTDLTVNGVPFPVTWSDPTSWRWVVPLNQATNDLTLAGVDRFGRPIPGFSDSIRVITTGVLPQVADFVVINEIQHDPAAPSASFLELHNRSTSTPFDLSGHRLEGIAYTFPTGALIPAGGFLVLARNRAGFDAAYGSGIPVFGEFPGSLDNDGERLALVRPDPAGGTHNSILDEVRYGIRFPWPTNTAGFGPSLQLLDPAVDNRRPGAWASTSIQAPNQATPGAVNAGRTTLPPFPAVWINEVLPSNTSSPADNLGEREPYVELVNAGTQTADLTTFFLTDRESDLTRWAFPAGTSIEPGGFLRLWADGEPGESAPGHLHLGFRIAPGSGMVALVRLQGPANAPAVMDAVPYTVSSPNRSFGSFPDGDPLRRRLFENPSPGAPNDPSVSEIPVTINELMSSNASALANPADGNFDDWFELHNRGNTAVDLSGFFLTDNLTQWNQTRIPPGFVIPPHGFLLVWADSEPGQNAVGGAGDLHVGFRLSAAGEQLGLFDPNGRMVDGVEFGPLADNAVLGRYPDGAAGSLLLLDQPSPHAPNVLAGGNAPPVLDPLVHRSIPEGSLLQFTVSATDPDPTQRLTFSLDAGAPTGAALDSQTGVFTWTPSEAQGPGIHVVGIRVTDNGVPPRSDFQPVTLTVTEVNLRPTLSPIANVVVEEGAWVIFDASASDADRPAQSLTFSLAPGAPPGAQVDPVTGRFTWLTDPDAGAGEHPLVMQVRDDGPGNLEDEQPFRVTIQPRFQVVISEVMSHPPTLNAEYIELLNLSQRTPWSLAGLRLEGGSLSHGFANTTLAPDTSLCVVRHLTAFRSAYGEVPTVTGTWTGALDPAGDRLRLIRPSTGGEPEVVLDEFRFEAAAPWPAAVRGGGASLQLVDARRDNTRPGNWTHATTFTGAMNLVRMTNEWRYYQNGPLPASWITPDFNHATWPIGRGLLYVESSDLPEPKSTPLTLGQNTYYFRTTFVLPSVPAGARLILHTVLDDGAVFYLNGREGFRHNIAPGVAVDFNTAASLVDNAVRTGPFTLPASALVAGTNLLAVEVHQVNTGSSDIVFGCSLEMEGGPVASFTPGTANNTASELPEFPPVWINEVLPLNTTGIADATGSREPWIELVNRSDDPVPLAGWYLSRNAETWNGWRFPDAAVLPPRSLVVLFADGQPDQTTATEWHADFRLDPSAGIVVLSRPQNGALAVVDYLRYTGLVADVSAVPSPEGPAGTSRPASPTPGTDPILVTPSLAIRSDPGRIELLIGTLPGRTHHLESRTSLDSGEWVLEQEIPGTGNPVLVPLSEASLSENRFFRVLVP